MYHNYLFYFTVYDLVIFHIIYSIQVIINYEFILYILIIFLNILYFDYLKIKFTGGHNI